MVSAMSKAVERRFRADMVRSSFSHANGGTSPPMGSVPVIKND